MKHTILLISLCLLFSCIKPLPPRVCIEPLSDSLVHVPEGWISPTEQCPSFSFADPALAAHLSRLAYYERNDSIRAYCEDVYINEIDTIPVDTGGGLKYLTGIKYFIWYDTSNNRQFVVIRGTYNAETIAADFLYPKIYDDSLDLMVHMGYYSITMRVINDIRSNLRPELETWLTGHSLGGAVALLTFLYFEKEQMKLGPLFTFGQPKVLTEKGVLDVKRRCLPIIRFVIAGDPVPGMPPSLKEKCPNPMHPGCNGTFRHIGDEVILAADTSCTYLTRHIPEESGIKALEKLIEDLKNDELKESVMYHLPNKYNEHMQLYKAKSSDSCACKP